MQTEVIMAGFGGQGLMMIGKLLAYAGMDEGMEVSWLPSYGPEMRGGTANCTVVLSDRSIGSPLVATPRALVAMNRPSLEKFAPFIRPGGLLVINSSLIPIAPDREDIEIFKIEANDIAMAEGSGRSANMVVLGAYVALTGIVSPESVIKLIEKTFAGKPKIIEINKRAFTRGYERAKGSAEE